VRRVARQGALTRAAARPVVVERPEELPAAFHRQVLGESWARDIIISLNGTIEVESEPDRFTTFRARLPAAGDAVA
jgi:hypothetical protein